MAAFRTEVQALTSKAELPALTLPNWDTRARSAHRGERAVRGTTWISFVLAGTCDCCGGTGYEG